MSTDTSIGPEGARGGNDDPGNADGCGNKTLGDKSTQQPAAGAEQAPDPAGAQVPARDTGRGESRDR